MPWERFRWPLAAALALAGAAILVWFLARRDDPPTVEIRYQPAEIKVYVVGAVQRPGVYTLSDGDRVQEAVAAAGGFADGADQVAINLAQRVHDEDEVVVLRQGESAPEPQPSASALLTEPVNINTAAVEQLDKLPGIGPVYAQRIVDSRTAQGLFQTADDLLTRKLIPRSTFEKIRTLITVGQ